MPMIGCGNDDCIDILVFKNVPIVAIGPQFDARGAIGFRDTLCDDITVDIA